ncbi:hypothetical protein NYF23_03805 [SAR92 clade bacterium H455]|jgi:hypothetical protein|uniref:YbgF trimerisation domain-containing protein n=1 Tax=SAR92 clade bacterium H455 TaxID=2974818 RepID=A0ABY5TU97_9GAMM|nr:hypothetical protein NYF23_03805 [SAR92 clade bacterium H455]
MKTIYLSMALLFLSTTVSAHSGADPVREVAKKRSYVLQYQKDYQTATSREEKISNIKKQVSTLQSTVLLLRNSLVKENSSIRSDLSRFDLDYLKAMKNSLKDMQKLLKQLDAVIED